MGSSISAVRSEEFTLEERGIVLVLEHAGDGLNGTFDPENPQDIPLIRFRFLQRSNGMLAEIDEASLPTMIPATTDRESLRRVARRLMDEVAPSILAGNPVGDICREVAWIDASGNIPQLATPAFR